MYTPPAYFNPATYFYKHLNPVQQGSNVGAAAQGSEQGISDSSNSSTDTMPDFVSNSDQDSGMEGSATEPQLDTEESSSTNASEEKYDPANSTGDDKVNKMKFISV